MSYSIKIIKRQGHKNIKWSGGESTQLYIYPENSSYEKQDFKFRISLATIQEEKSIFTKLEGITRELMIIDGKLTLAYENKKSVLNKYEKERLNGGTKTISYGKAKDFNLMVNNNYEGNLEYFKIKEDKVLDINYKMYKNDYRHKFYCFYSLNNSFKIHIDNNRLIDVGEGDFIMIKFKKGSINKISMINEGIKDLEIIKSTINI